VVSELRFDWDPRKAVANLQKHRISFEEAQSRFILLGLSAGLRVLFVCHCVRETGSLIRIISAQRANRHEQKQYHERLCR
jgi:uncharacterized protein